MYTQLKKSLQSNNISFCLDEPMKLHTSFKIGGPADVFVLPDSIEKCCKVISLCSELGINYMVIGKGSNLLVNDDGFRGVIVCISNLISDIELVDETKIKCGAGANLSSLCNFALTHNLTGAEFAYGIPGSVGGAVYMNAGAYGGEMKDIVCSCEYINQKGELCTINKDEIDFSYRHSYFSDKCLCITNVVFELKKGDAAAIKQTMTELLNRRKEKQPLDLASAGSTFKRPQGSYASMLIDQCGLKGYRVGDAQVSEKHAGFVVNLGNASFKDVTELCKNVSDIVFDKTGFKLEMEVKII